MFLIVLGISIFIWGAYYGVKSLYVHHTTPPPRGNNHFDDPDTSDMVVIFLRIASQILIFAIVIMALLKKTLPGMIFIQGAFAIVMAFGEAVVMDDHLKSTEDTRRKIEGKYDVKWDPKRKTAEISDHYEGSGPVPWQSILAFPFRLVHNFCLLCIV